MTRLQHGAGAAAVLAMSALVCGCGATTGKTTHGAVALDHLPLSRELRALQLNSVEGENEGVRLIAIGVQPWGKFDDEDRANLRLSLDATLKAAMTGRIAGAENPIQLYVLIRKYVIGASNSEAAVWAYVGWCAVGGDEQVLFDEAFYATGAVQRIGSLGGVKDRVNRAIVKRIAQSAVLLADGAKPKEVKVADTYPTFDAAMAATPDLLETWGLAFLSTSARPLL